MRPHAKWFVVLAVLAVPTTGWGCEPILPLVQLLGGSTMAGPMLLTQSLLWLGAAVVIKCGAFAFFERRLAWWKAAFLMLLGNVASTIPGYLIAVFAGSIGIIGLPLMGLLGIWIGWRHARFSGSRKNPWLTVPLTALGFVVFFFLSVLLFALAQGALDGHDFTQYWMTKFLFVTLVACTGILMSAVLEECFIALFAGKSSGDFSFYTPVIRANYLTLAVVLLVAAGEMLPKRLNAPHFIVSWLHALSVALGSA
jgi:hypothetical protein